MIIYCLLTPEILNQLVCLDVLCIEIVRAGRTADTSLTEPNLTEFTSFKCGTQTHLFTSFVS